MAKTTEELYKSMEPELTKVAKNILADETSMSAMLGTTEEALKRQLFCLTTGLYPKEKDNE